MRKSLQASREEDTRPQPRPQPQPHPGRRISDARLQSILQIKLPDLYSIISQAMLEENVDLQERVIQLYLTRILEFKYPGTYAKPFPEQVGTLRLMIYHKGDTLLIARTGFGKSLIFHAYAILTGKITIQIVPLNTLGDEQARDIGRLSCAKPCLITAETKQKDSGLPGGGRKGEVPIWEERKSGRGLEDATCAESNNGGRERFGVAISIRSDKIEGKLSIATEVKKFGVIEVGEIQCGSWDNSPTKIWCAIHQKVPEFSQTLIWS